MTARSRICQECGMPTVMFGPLCNPKGLPYCVPCLDLKDPATCPASRS